MYFLDGTAGPMTTGVEAVAAVEAAVAAVEAAEEERRLDLRVGEKSSS